MTDPAQVSTGGGCKPPYLLSGVCVWRISRVPDRQTVFLRARSRPYYQGPDSRDESEAVSDDPIQQQFPTDYVLAQWAYSELLSFVQGRKYQGAGVPELRKKARQKVPFEELDQQERNVLLAGWHAVRGGFTAYLDGVSAFQLEHWSREKLADVLVIPHFVRDIVSDTLVTAFQVQVPFNIWIEAEPVRPLHQFHARFAIFSPPSSQSDPLTVGRDAGGEVVPDRRLSPRGGVLEQLEGPP
jgi:hypothetical protein